MKTFQGSFIKLLKGKTSYLLEVVLKELYGPYEWDGLGWSQEGSQDGHRFYTHID